MRKDTGRTRKIGELIRRELAVLIPREIGDPRAAQATLTAVEVVPDLSLARVFITHLGGAVPGQAAVDALNHAAGFLRHQLRERVILRHVPELRFAYDPSIERGDTIERLLARARSERGEQ